MILEWKSVAQKLKIDLQELSKHVFPRQDKYVALLFFGENAASSTYVKLKKRFGKDIGINVEIFGQEDYLETDNEDLVIYKNQEYDIVPKVLELIHFLNYDTNCVGVVVQLPLPEDFQQQQNQILSSISPTKDIDGLGGVINGLSGLWLINFIPATPKSVLNILKHYKLDKVEGKTIAILGQSNLVGKSLAIELMKMWATIYSTNHYNSQQKIKSMTKQADYIISCTGQIHLIDPSYLRDDQSQILIDVGYGYKDWKPVWDIQLDKVSNMVKDYTPVPGGIGPMTVACLFENIFVLQWHKDVLRKFKL